MPICQKNKFIFIHIPKTAGTSIEKALKLDNKNCLFNKEKYKNYPVCPQHLYLSEIIKEFPESIEYKIFTVVRNPFDRMVSAFSYWKKTYSYNLSFIEFVKNSIESSNRRYDYDGHMELQINYIDYNLPIKLFRFEELRKNLLNDWLLKEFNISINLGYENRSNNRFYYKRYYNKETIDMIYNFYSKDLERFNYKF